jgi:hypothetical protein
MSDLNKVLNGSIHNPSWKRSVQSLLQDNDLVDPSVFPAQRPIHIRWVDNVNGSDLNDGTKDSPYQSIRHARNQLIQYDLEWKVINVVNTGVVYTDYCVLNTSFWVLQGVGEENPRWNTLPSDKSGHTPLIITTLTDAALDEYVSQGSAKYVQGSAQFDYIGGDLDDKAIQPVSKIVPSRIGADWRRAMYVIVRNLTILPAAATAGQPIEVFDGEADRNSILVLGGRVETNGRGGITDIIFEKTELSVFAGFLVIKNGVDIEIGNRATVNLMLDNCQSTKIHPAAAIGAVRARQGNTNGTTNEVFPYSVTGGLGNITLFGSPSSVKSFREFNLAGNQTIPSSLIFVASDIGFTGGRAQTTTFSVRLGGRWVLGSSWSQTDLTPIVFSYQGDLSILQNAAARCTLYLTGALTMDSTQPSFLKGGFVTGTTTQSGSGAVTYDNMIFESLVTVSAGTATFNNCQFKAGITVSGGTVNLNGCKVMGVATQSGGSATATISLFQNARVGTWTINAPV